MPRDFEDDPSFNIEDFMDGIDADEGADDGVGALDDADLALLAPIKLPRPPVTAKKRTRK